jgi:ankyrin repeat protein
VQKKLNDFPQTRNAVNQDGSTPLHMATAGGHVDVINAIIKDCTNVLSVTENDGWTIAHIACFHGHAHVLYVIELHCARILFKKDMNGLLPSDVCVEESCRKFFQSMDLAENRSEAMLT